LISGPSETIPFGVLENLWLLLMSVA